MTEAEFEAELKAQGYQEIVRQDLAARAPKDEHGHEFTIRGLVLLGKFIVNQSAGRQVCGPGDIFFVEQGDPHDEEIGPKARAFWSDGSIRKAGT